MKNSKKLFSLILVLTIVLTMVLTGCSNNNTPQTTPSGATPTPASAEPKTVRIGIAADPATLAPWAVMSDGRVDVLRNVYEFLFDYERIGGEIIPCIATDYTQIDPKTYTVTINDNVKDSKGNLITADDVVFSYNSCIELGNQAVGMNPIESVTALDATTVQFKFNTTAAGSFTNAVTYCAIVSKSEYEANPDAFTSTPIGTGPYVVDDFVPGSSVAFSKNSNYWQTDESLRAPFSQANIEHITYKVIPESSQLTMALESGDIDIGYYVASSDVHRFENDSYNVTAIARDLMEVILFNCDESNVFSNEALRKAVCYAIDSQVVLDNAYDGVGGIGKTYGSPIFGDYLDEWNEQDYYEFSIEKAKEMLVEAGYPDGLNVTLMTDNSNAHVKMAQVIQSLLKNVDITVEIVQYDDTLISTYRFDPTQFDFYIASKSSFDYITSVWKFSFDANAYKGKTLNFYVDDKLQTLLNTAMDANTHTPENINAVHEYLKEICIGYGICYGTNYLVSTNTVTDLALDSKTRVLGGACTYADGFVGAKN